MIFVDFDCNAVSSVDTRGDGTVVCCEYSVTVDGRRAFIVAYKYQSASDRLSSPFHLLCSPLTVTSFDASRFPFHSVTSIPRWPPRRSRSSSRQLLLLIRSGETEARLLGSFVIHGVRGKRLDLTAVFLFVCFFYSENEKSGFVSLVSRYLR